MEKIVIILAGPTAVGKTKVAIDLARHFSTEIISADSRQCYKELNIGVAKPDQTELLAAPHHFISSHSISDRLTAADFEKFALEKSSAIFKKNNVLLMTGGTGLYIKAFAEGLDLIPPVDENSRQAVHVGYDTGGLSWLQQQIVLHDPIFAKLGEMQNPRRLMRALEVKMSTGKSIIEYQSATQLKRDFRVINIALERPRNELYERINLRVEEMVKQGLEEEARGLVSFKHLPSLQTVGYREFFDFFEGKTSKEQTIELIKQNTRHYSKRQTTWFRNQSSFLSIEPSFEKILEYVNGLTKK